MQASGSITCYFSLHESVEHLDVTLAQPEKETFGRSVKEFCSHSIWIVNQAISRYLEAGVEPSA